METYTPASRAGRIAVGCPRQKRRRRDTLSGHGMGDFAAAAHVHSSLDAPYGSPTQALLLDKEGNVAVKGNLDMGQAAAPSSTWTTR
jgi:hypothetical protein